MFSHYSQLDAEATSNILLRRHTEYMDIPVEIRSQQSPEKSTLLTLVGMVIVLLLVAIIIVGSGLQSGFVWLILAGICIAWVFVCSCSNCKKMANLRLRRTNERSDTISTISDFNDLSYIGYPHLVPIIDETRVWAQDLPPSYDVVSHTLEQQPPSYASVIELLNPTNNMQGIDLPRSSPLPPPYSENLPCTNLSISTADNRCSPTPTSVVIVK